MKQVWVKAATCSCTPRTTDGAALPTETTAMPEPRSISELPSASTMTPPPAAVDEDRQRGADAVGDGGLLAGQQLGRARAGDLGDEAAFLREGRAAGDGLGHGVNVGNRSAPAREPLRIRQAGRVDIDWIRRPTSPGADDGTLNLCFNALDRHVVHGLADEIALRVDRYTAGRTELTFARLLEEVAAFGGVLRAFGVGPGERVLSRLPMGAEGLVAALATGRLGGVHVISDPYADPVAPSPTHRPAVVLAEGSDVSARRCAGRGRRARRGPRSGEGTSPRGTTSSGTC